MPRSCANRAARKPFSRFPQGQAGAEKVPPTPATPARPPPQEGFQNAPLKTPLRDPPGAHPGESVQSKTMRAAKQESEVFPLAAFCLLAENPHLGHRLPTAALHRGFTPVNSNTATRFQAFLYDSGRRSRSTGKERDSETGLDYFGARHYGSKMAGSCRPIRCRRHRNDCSILRNGISTATFVIIHCHTRTQQA